MSSEAEVALKANFGYFLSVATKKVIIYLLVEGRTDEKFIGKLNVENLKCIAIGPISQARGYILYENEKYRNTPIDWEFIIDDNSKQSILNIVKKQDKKDIYGLVDKDFDATEDIQTYHKNVLVTFTHDLETLLLLTDKTIFEKPENITESLDNALYLSYLIGKVKKYLKKIYRLKSLQNTDYENIINIHDVSINLIELINRLIEERRDHNPLKQNEKLQLERELKNAISIDMDDVLYMNDLYDIANGHDISNILKLLCEPQINVFVESYNPEGYGDKAVEFAIINKYNPKSFKNCPLHKDMIRKGLVPTAI